MKRIATTGAALAFGVVTAVGLISPAHSAPADQQASDVSAQFCGLDRAAQSYTNCAPHGVYVSLAFYDSVQNAAGNATPCVAPGTTSIFALLGPFRLAYSSYEAEPC